MSNPNLDPAKIKRNTLIIKIQKLKVDYVQ
jgi:hypothetical protein